MRRNDRTAKLGSEPLDSCGVLRGIPHLGSLGSVLRARRFRVLGYQPPHTVEVESKPSGWILELSYPLSGKVRERVEKERGDL